MIVIFDISQFVSKHSFKNPTVVFKQMYIKKKYYYIRPGTEEFFNECKDKFEIAFWNFKTKKNCRKTMKAFLDIINITPKFIWYRNLTKLVRVNGVLSNAVEKNIDTIIYSPSLNKDYEYNNNNVRLCSEIDEFTVGTDIKSLVTMTKIIIENKDYMSTITSFNN